MEAVIEAPNAKREPDLVHRWVQIWISDCNQFRRWEREELILKEPSDESLAEHRKKSQLLVISARLLQGLMATWDRPASEFQAEVAGKVRQLEETFAMIHNPMNDQEAEAILQKAFPDGPRIGRTA